MGRTAIAKKKLLEFFKSTKEDGPISARCGLCSNLIAYCAGDHQIDIDLELEMRKLLYVLLTAWPEHSGDEAFPVPSPRADWDANTAYFSLPGNMYSKRGKYGRARRRLIDWCIEQLEADRAN